MKKVFKFKKQYQLFALALLASAGAAQATEGGGSTYPAGVENFMAGVAPPPGLHFLGYGSSYSSNKVMDNSGNNANVPGFKVQVNAVSLRAAWVSPYEMLGGSLALHTIIPVVDISLSLGGASQHKTGLGDVTVGAAVVTHYSPKLHTVLGLDFVLPVGGYNQADMVNIGRNYLSTQTTYILSYLDPTGFNGDVKLTFNFNQKNSATQYTSGDEVFADYSAGYGFGNGWTAGVGGHLRQQFNDDVKNGVTVANNRASSFSIGPSVKYDNGKGWFITAKLQQEVSVKNTTQGSALWIKSTIPF